jgi:hypothetical protein
MSDELDRDLSVQTTPRRRFAPRWAICSAAPPAVTASDIVREIIAIVNEVARGLPPGGGQDSRDDGMPGG